MRQKLLRAGAKELSYEIRGIVQKAEQVRRLGREISWENIGDPIQKQNTIPTWMKEIVAGLAMEDKSYGYVHSKGILETREYLAQKTNAAGGVQISAGDITFFNGLGDAISKVYQFLDPTARVIGPSPAYSTHSSAEAAHANHEPITYRLNPGNHWYPDLVDLENQVKYNKSIVGILLINPDNPTGMVYPNHILEAFVDIARRYDLFIVADEIYLNITYNGAKTSPIAQVIGEVPAISLKGISKELPWPGSRCGWAEYYNRDKDPAFDALCQTLDNAKMMEVCSTTLPQMALRPIMEHEAYPEYRLALNKTLEQKSRHMQELLADIPYIRFNESNGAFYNTILFNEQYLNDRQRLVIDNPEIEKVLQSWLAVPGLSQDFRFVYHLLAATGICVVPVSSFCSPLKGFRVTLLENDPDQFRKTFTTLRESIIEYIKSDPAVLHAGGSHLRRA